MVRILFISVVLLCWLMRDVRCEMRKSWKVKSGGDEVENSVLETEHQHVQTKMSRMEPDPEQVTGEDVQQNAVDAETETVTEQQTSPTTTSTTVGTVSSSTAKTSTRARLRSTYIGNRTSALFNSLRESVKAAPFIEDHEPDIQIDDFSADEVDEDEFEHEDKKDNTQKDEKDPYAEGYDMIDNILDEVKSIADGEKPAEQEEHKESESSEPVKQYDFGPVLNMTVDEPNSIVNVKLNEKVLRDLFTGRAEGGGFGGSKKLWKYAMPLFILPFLIQSAVVPFMLMTVKLFLFKSFMAGKLAILLLLLGAFKNFSNKKDKEVYVKDLPERRYEPYEWPYPYHSAESGRPSWAK